MIRYHVTGIMFDHNDYRLSVDEYTAAVSESKAISNIKFRLRQRGFKGYLRDITTTELEDLPATASQLNLFGEVG